MEGEFLLDPLLERLALLKGKRVGLGNHGNDIDDVGQLLQHNNVNGLEATPLSVRTLPMVDGDSRMAGRLDEEQATVDAGILDITVTLGSEFLSEVCRMLVLDVLHNWVPTAQNQSCYQLLSMLWLRAIPSVVVDLVAVSGSVDNV